MRKKKEITEAWTTYLKNGPEDKELYALLTEEEVKSELNERYAHVLEHRLRRNRTYTEIGKDMTISSCRVRQIYASAILKIKKLHFEKTIKVNP